MNRNYVPTYSQANWRQNDIRETEDEATERRIYEAVKTAMAEHPTTSGDHDHLIALACQQAARSMLALLGTTETED